MGNIRQRNNKWVVDLFIGGKRYRRTVSKSRKLAEFTLRKAERNQLGFLERKNITLQELFKEYSQFSQTNYRLATQTRYPGVAQIFLRFMNEINPNIGNDGNGKALDG